MHACPWNPARRRACAVRELRGATPLHQVHPRGHNLGPTPRRAPGQGGLPGNPTELSFIAAKGIHTGQFPCCGKKAQLNLGSVLPAGTMPEGTILCCLEEKPGDRGKRAPASGNYATIISHNPKTKRTGVKLHSGSKKVISCANRAVIDVACGGGRIDKPIVKAGGAHKA